MAKPHVPPMRVFTDGSFSSAFSTVGGIGVHFPEGELEDISSVFYDRPTNQRAELLAVLRAIESVRQDNKQCERNIHIYTDSRYAMDACGKWMLRWKSNGWKTADGKDVLNQDLLRPLSEVLKNVRFHHVRAHTGDTDDISVANAVADKLAKRAIKNEYTRTRPHTTHFGTNSTSAPSV